MNSTFTRVAPDRSMDQILQGEAAEIGVKGGQAVRLCVCA